MLRFARLAQDPSLTNLTVTVKGTTAIVRWRGSSTTTTYDIALRRPPAAWKTLARGLRPTSRIVRGKKGQRYQVRIAPAARNGPAALGQHPAPSRSA